MQIMSLTPIGAAFFRGAPPPNSPVVQIDQKLGGRVIEITKIEDDPANSNPRDALSILDSEHIPIAMSYVDAT
jgi:hypothetical protein